MEVQIDHLQPDIEVDLEKRRVLGKSSAIHQQIHRAKPPHRFVDQMLRSAGRTDVTGDGRSFAPGLRDFRNDRLEGRGISSREDDTVAIAGESQSRSLADASCGSGDNGGRAHR
jgi:hypothetical protein